MQDKEVINFWKWFVDNKDKLESDNYEPTILQRLDETISSWDLNWEIGPGQSKENSLTISPKGSPALLQLTEQIISKAPTVDKWEFYSTKQPKENWYLLELSHDNISVDASEWEYVLLKYKDGKIEVLVKAENLMEYDKDTKELIVEIILMNLLGERMFMERVDYFDVVEEFDSEAGITEIKYLSEHLNDKFFF
ncbi:hypothetical protein AHMF7605_20235 [Adhaeribacter arboris]|uniref:DUF695 domain-containing protein n=1 Tax=Adhaeribacter arboris TaxID=2072846 RepID=A0A2T2YJH9_9BACT|nr:hypothetical protein [Adhaeribacter arboris]PSR55666.1 hypothetical protein AHMF7605_20235 [Adhaeribacter arboris]